MRYYYLPEKGKAVPTETIRITHAQRKAQLASNLNAADRDFVENALLTLPGAKSVLPSAFVAIMPSRALPKIPVKGSGLDDEDWEEGNYALLRVANFLAANSIDYRRHR